MGFLWLCVIFVLILQSTRCDGSHFSMYHVGLREVPSNISSTTTSLDLGWNSIKIIKNDSFINLCLLTSLDLADNEIKILEPWAFRGLSQLISLNLRNNWLVPNYNVYPATVFLPLRKLQTLDLHRNVHFHHQEAFLEVKEYPDEIFKNLGALKELSLDGINNVVFGSGFSHMTDLKSLSLYQMYSADILRRDTLAVFGNMTIESLVVESPRFEVGSLKHFPHLVNLKIRANGLQRALAALVDVRDHNLTSLVISKCNPSPGSRLKPEELMLTKNNTKHLATMCVRNLDLSDNAIIHTDLAMVLSLEYPECVENLNIGQNYLTVASHWVTVFGFQRFTNLKYCDVSTKRSARRSKRAVKPYSHQREELRSKHDNGEEMVFNVPPHLEAINVSFLDIEPNSLTSIKLFNADNMRVVDLAYVTVVDCAFTVSGLGNLSVLNISGFDCSNLSPFFFEPYPALTVLEAKNCKLDTGFQNDPDGITFRTLKQLHTLDLSNNDLTKLHPDLFKSLVSLESLILANNKLVHLGESVISVESLKYVDLSYNVINALQSQELSWLSQRLSVRLSLRHNPFMCTCETLTFVHWLLRDPVNLADKTSTYTCDIENGTEFSVHTLTTRIKDMDVNCVSKFWLTFSVVGSCLLTIAVISGIFGYRYRWNIKYWFLTKCRTGSTHERLPEEQYEFDAFVAYHHENWRWPCEVLRNILEVENQYKLCLNDRDFPVAESIQQNIVDAVNNSRKIILVVDRAFLTSDWCEFEIQMAGMRMVRDGRKSAIIVIMMEEIPVAEMPRSLLNLWQNITFLLWNKDNVDEQIFWRRLLEVMAR